MTARASSASVIYGICSLLDGGSHGDTIDHYFSYGSGLKIDITNATKLYKWTKS